MLFPLQKSTSKTTLQEMREIFRMTNQQKAQDIQMERKEEARKVLQEKDK